MASTKKGTKTSPRKVTRVNAAGSTCGLVMPISAIDGATADHWAEVKAIITEAVEAIDEVKFTVRLVSDADEIGVIQKRIVQNIYTSDIIACDVSGKNPNVMFELGMRLAFDKATVIVKDDKTDYSFDTGIIEHVVTRATCGLARLSSSNALSQRRCCRRIRSCRQILTTQFS